MTSTLRASKILSHIVWIENTTAYQTASCSLIVCWRYIFTQSSISDLGESYALLSLMNTEKIVDLLKDMVEFWLHFL